MVTFDLISDLHLDYWEQNINDWRGLPTSLYCVVAGDISRDPKLTTSFLKHLADCYKHVIFVEGNHEHNKKYSNMIEVELELDEALHSISNITYLNSQSCMINGTAFIGAMGWWTFDFPHTQSASYLEVMDAFCNNGGYPLDDAVNIWQTAQEEAEDLCEVIQSLQEDELVDEIVMVTHTVPRNDLIPSSMPGSIVDWGKVGNSRMIDVLNFDRKKKISTWCFGHYHELAFDVEKDGVRYISHPRGTPKDAISSVYYPKIVTTNREMVIRL